MALSKNNCIVQFVCDKNIKKLIEYYSNISKLSISQFCYNAIWEKIYKLKHRGFSMKIEKIEELNLLIGDKIHQGQNCIIAIKDNKSDINIQSVIVKHPIDFLRNLNEFSKNLRIPVSDMSILLVGYISQCFNLEELDDIVEISPYVYFKKPEEVEINVGSDDSSSSVES